MNWDLLRRGKVDNLDFYCVETLKENFCVYSHDGVLCDASQLVVLCKKKKTHQVVKLICDIIMSTDLCLNDSNEKRKMHEEL